MTLNEKQMRRLIELLDEKTDRVLEQIREVKKGRTLIEEMTPLELHWQKELHDLRVIAGEIENEIEMRGWV